MINQVKQWIFLLFIQGLPHLDGQTAYYEALAEADKIASATPFIEFMLQALHDAMTEVLIKTSVITSGKTSGKIIDALNKNCFMTIPELAHMIGISTRSIERNLQKLQKDGRLRRIGAAKGGHWEVLK